MSLTILRLSGNTPLINDILIILHSGIIIKSGIILSSFVGMLVGPKIGTFDDIYFPANKNI